MDNHDRGHDQRDNVHKIRGALKDDGVREFNSAGVACRLHAGDHAGDGGRRAHEGAERYRDLLAYRMEVSKAHLDGVCGSSTVGWKRKGGGGLTGRASA